MVISAKTFLILACILTTAESHGYLKTPRSRNFVASQDGVSFGGTSADPTKEYCPQCLNRGGSVAACGLVESHNYDFPPNAVGGTVPINIQATYAHGDVIDFDIVLTAHHKGHFAFYACPVNAGEIPTDDCFKEHPLEFVEDLLYGATKDSNYPERAYIPPLTYSNIVTEAASVPGTLYQYRMKLPDDIEGALVLVQWHYISGNSCTDKGYADYNFPVDWPDLAYTTIPVCSVIPADGNGVPEQFWNCAEISVLGDGSTRLPVAAPTRAPVAEPTNAPVTAPTMTTQSPAVTVSITASPVAIVITPAPVATTPTETAAPVSTHVTSSPVVTPTSDGPFQVSTAARCGASELEGRGNCGAVCSSSADCGSEEWCWGVQANYCDSNPSFRTCPDLTQANSIPRCGTSELDARELCGALCTTNDECAGINLCWSVHANTCDCQHNGGDSSRMLRGDFKN